MFESGFIRRVACSLGLWVWEDREEANVVGPFYAQVVSRGPHAMQGYVEFRRDPNGNPEPWPWVDEQ